ncbi:HAD family hydrolase [Brevibacillus fluminis]|uniref:HAD family hydrolase n=1 Tax=Brevibacillus fluminis TaxID=511487 RepID=A0A3M8DWC5_9BACL|nr:HAD family hydrolase [Brevibacillus fluminis]
MEACKVILFDLDDTLYDFSACWETGMRETIRTHPLTRDLDTDAFYEKLAYYNDALWPQIADRSLTFNEYRHVRLQNSLGHFDRQAKRQESDDFQALFRQKNEENMLPVEETTALITELSGRYRLGIVTNGPADMTDKKLERLQLAHLFPPDTVFISELIGHHKPDKRIFQHVLAQMGADAHETLFVGDNWIADVAGAMDAGISAVWLNAHGHEPQTPHVPLAMIEQLADLRTVLKKK